MRLVLRGLKLSDYFDGVNYDLVIFDDDLVPCIEYDTDGEAFMLSEINTYLDYSNGDSWSFNDL